MHNNNINDQKYTIFYHMAIPTLRLFREGEQGIKRGGV